MGGRLWNVMVVVVVVCDVSLASGVVEEVKVPMVS